MEYLVIIAFLALLIPFWLVLNNQKAYAGKFQKALGVLTSKVLRIPQGLLYGKNHTWMYMEKSGAAKVGLDDLLLHITGEVKFSSAKNPGEMIRKGDLLTELTQNGKILRIFSPVSGMILDTNSMLNENSGILNEDPYGKGWICKIKPTHWIEEAKTCYFAEDATDWTGKELDRFRDFLARTMKDYTAETAMIMMQDGGELVDHSLSVLPDEIWKDFQSEFLDPGLSQMSG